MRWGGAYNQRWKEELDDLGHLPTIQGIEDIRYKLVEGFGLEQYRP